VKLNRDAVRALIWLSLTTLIAIAAFWDSAHPRKPDKLVFFDWSVPKGVAAEAVFLLAPAFLLATGDWKLLALRKPERVRRAAALGVAAVLGAIALDASMSLFGNPGKEQGLAPDHWIGGHGWAFAASFVATVVAVPIVEEIYFRGIGLGLLLRLYGPLGAIVLCGCLFGLVHGILLGLVPLAFFGGMLALIRVTTGSVFPGILVHGAYNTLAVLVSLHWL
jgi:membrane protease YdiL (CAAX protease family)